MSCSFILMYIEPYLWIVPMIISGTITIMGLKIQTDEIIEKQRCHYNCPYCEYFKKMDAKSKKDEVKTK